MTQVSPAASSEVRQAMYDRLTGRFSILGPCDDGGQERVLWETTGYAGHGKGVNAPGFSHVARVGPLPPGGYHVGLPQRHPRLGPVVFRLRPEPGNVMFGREGFFIHGDNGKGDRSGSLGCIILTRQGREAVQNYRVRHLQVT